MVSMRSISKYLLAINSNEFTGPHDPRQDNLLATQGLLSTSRLGAHLLVWAGVNKVEIKPETTDSESAGRFDVAKNTVYLNTALPDYKLAAPLATMIREAWQHQHKLVPNDTHNAKLYMQKMRFLQADLTSHGIAAAFEMRAEDARVFQALHGQNFNMAHHYLVEAKSNPAGGHTTDNATNGTAMFSTFRKFFTDSRFVHETDLKSLATIEDARAQKKFDREMGVIEKFGASSAPAIPVIAGIDVTTAAGIKKLGFSVVAGRQNYLDNLVTATMPNDPVYMGRMLPMAQSRLKQLKF